MHWQLKLAQSGTYQYQKDCEAPSEALYPDQTGMHRVDHDCFEVWQAASMATLVLKVHRYFAVHICAGVQQHEMKQGMTRPEWVHKTDVTSRLHSPMHQIAYPASCLPCSQLHGIPHKSWYGVDSAYSDHSCRCKHCMLYIHVYTIMTQRNTAKQSREVRHMVC